MKPGLHESKGWLGSVYFVFADLSKKLRVKSRLASVQDDALVSTTEHKSKFIFVVNAESVEQSFAELSTF